MKNGKKKAEPPPVVRLLCHQPPAQQGGLHDSAERQNNARGSEKPRHLRCAGIPNPDARGADTGCSPLPLAATKAADTRLCHYNRFGYRTRRITSRASASLSIRPVFLRAWRNATHCFLVRRGMRPSKAAMSAPAVLVPVTLLHAVVRPSCCGIRCVVKKREQFVLRWPVVLSACLNQAIEELPTRHFSRVDHVGLDVPHRRPRLFCERLPFGGIEAKEKLFEIRGNHGGGGYYRNGQCYAT